MGYNLNNERDIHAYGFWDRIKLAFVPTQVIHDSLNWQYIYFKEYQGMVVIVSKERYH